MVVWNSHVNILASLIFNSYAWVFVKSCSFHIYITCYLCWAYGGSILWHILVVGLLLVHVSSEEKSISLRLKYPNESSFSSKNSTILSLSSSTQKEENWLPTLSVLR